MSDALEHDIAIIESALRHVGSAAADASWPRLVAALRTLPALSDDAEGAPVKQTDTDPGDIGEPRILYAEEPARRPRRG